MAVQNRKKLINVIVFLWRATNREINSKAHFSIQLLHYFLFKWLEKYHLNLRTGAHSSTVVLTVTSCEVNSVAICRYFFLFQGFFLFRGIFMRGNFQIWHHFYLLPSRVVAASWNLLDKYGLIWATLVVGKFPFF